MDKLIVILPFIIIALVLYFVFKYTKKVNAKKQKLIENFALTNGLKHEVTKKFFTSFNTVIGKYKGHHFSMYEIMQGSGKNRHLVTYFQFLNTNITFDFRINKEHFFSKTGKMLGIKDIEVRNEEFDKTFYLKSKNEQALKDLLNYEMQTELMLVKNYLISPIIVKAGVMTYTLYGGLNKNKLEIVLPVLNVMIKLIEKSNRR